MLKALNGQAPSYINDLLVTYAPNRSLRSGEQSLLSIPRSRLARAGDRAFSRYAPKIWNSLPQHVKDSPSVPVFRKQLKTHFYRIAFMH